MLDWPVVKLMRLANAVGQLMKEEGPKMGPD